MKGRSLTDRDHILWLLLHQTMDEVLKCREKELSQYGISTAESRVMFVIQANGNDVTPAEIARWTSRKNHTVSALLERMRKKGMITKVKDLNRKNVWRVSLTEKGQEAFRESIKRESIHTILSVLSEDERQQLESCLRKIRNQALNHPVSERTLPFP